MRVLFRVDASVVIGIGHVMRCLTLAKALQARGAQVVFVCRELDGHQIDCIQRDFTVLRLPAAYQGETSALTPESSVSEEADFTAVLAMVGTLHFDWCVLDHYGLGLGWQQQVMQVCSRLLVIDDLPSRHKDCDLLLDQNLLSEPSGAYPGRSTRRLFGPSYSLLRDEFLSYRALPRPQQEGLPKLLVFFGGGASALELLRVLPVLLPLPVRLDIVISSATPERATLERMLEGQQHASLHVDTEQMAKLLHAADLYVGAGGTVTWERACLGLPGVVAALSFNQQAISSACAEWGMQDYLGLSSTVQPIDWQLTVSQLLAQPERLERMRQRALALVDGRGVGRVVEAMECQV